MKKTIISCAVIVIITLLSVITINADEPTYRKTSYTYDNGTLTLISGDITGFEVLSYIIHESGIEQKEVKKIVFEQDISFMEGGACEQLFMGFTNCQEIIFNNCNTSKVTSMANMFYDCKSLKRLDLSCFDTSNVINMSNMFADCPSLTELNLSNFDTSNVKDMSFMFAGCPSLTELDLSGFDTSNVINMSYMFSGLKLSSIDLSGMDTSNVTDMRAFFRYCDMLVSLDLTSFDTSNVTSMSYMFDGCASLVSIDMSNFDTSKVTDMSAMFQGCHTLKTLNLSSFDTSNVINMSYMFNNDYLLEVVNLSNFNTSKVTDMGGMFFNCESLIGLDINRFDTSSVTDTECMFYGCESLNSLDVSSFNTSNVRNMRMMFSGCSSLIGLDVSNFDISNVESLEQIFGGCSLLKTLDISGFEISDNVNTGVMFISCDSLSSITLPGGFRITELMKLPVNKNGEKWVTQGSDEVVVSKIVNGYVTLQNPLSSPATIVLKPLIDESDCFFSFDSKVTAPGKILSIDLLLNSRSEVTTLGIGPLNYDSDVLEFLGFSDYGEIVENSSTGELGFDESNKTITFGYFEPEKLNGKICALIFKVLETPDCDTQITAETIVKNDNTVISSTMKPGIISIRNYIPGDVNMDGVVTIKDVAMVLNHSIAPDLFPIEYPGDMDFTQDGNIDIKDAVLLLQYSIFPNLYPLPNDASSNNQNSASYSGYDQCPSSVGLEYVDNGDGTCTITGIGSCTDSNIVIPDKINGLIVCSIGNTAFAENPNIYYLRISDSVKIVDRCAFWCCTNLKQVELSNNLVTIGDGAFSYTKITNIVFPKTLVSIEEAAFSGCEELRSVTLNENLKKIGSNCFWGCSSLTNMIVPNSVNYIGWAAFAGCSSLTNIMIPEGVTSIDGQVFSDCASLINITIPNSVTSINFSAFSGCTSLTSITIPKNVLEIDTQHDKAFNSCVNLKNIIINTCNIVEIAEYLKLGNLPNLKNVIIGENVNEIPDHLFGGCDSLEKVEVLTNKIKVIGEGSFGGCKSLKYFDIPQSVTTIGAFAFSGCSSLETVILPTSLTDIGDSAFNNCLSLKSITIPSNVKNIGPYAFNSLESITIYSSCVSKDFFKSLRNTIENVIWGADVDINEELFMNCQKLNTINITSNCVHTIGSCAFYNCSSLETLIIPNSINSIDNCAFSGCNISDVYYSGSISSWNMINELKRAFIGNQFVVHCSDGDTQFP